MLLLAKMTRPRPRPHSNRPCYCIAAAVRPCSCIAAAVSPCSCIDAAVRPRRKINLFVGRLQ